MEATAAATTNNQEQQAPVQTKRCGTCEKEIDVTKFRIHEIGCARSNYKCLVCGEIVAKAEKEDHDKEAHVKVQCQHCLIEFSKRELEGHEAGAGCPMKPKPCRFCEQIIKFVDYDSHANYCGSKTKKCILCNHNVMLRDEDMHNFGGECGAFIEEDKKKKDQEDKKKQELIKKEKEKAEKEREKKEQIFQQNFGIVDDEDEEWAVSDPDQYQKNQAAKKAGTQSRAPGATAAIQVPKVAGAPVSQARVGLARQGSSGPSSMMPPSQTGGVKPPGGIKPVPTGPPATHQQIMSRPVISNPPQSVSTKPGITSKGSAAAGIVVSNNRPSSRQKPSAMAKPEETKGQLRTSTQQKPIAIPSGQPRGPITNNVAVKPSVAQSKPASTTQGGGLPSSVSQQPHRQPKLEYNTQPATAGMGTGGFGDYDETEQAIARILQEEEDMMRAQQLQNDYYTGNRPPTATVAGSDGSSRTSNRSQVQQPPSERVQQPVFEQLIPDSRNEYMFNDEDENWAMDEHNPGNLDVVGTGYGQQTPHIDADYEKALLESLKNADRHGDQLQLDEDALLQQALEESRKHR